MNVQEVTIVAKGIHMPEPDEIKKQESQSIQGDTPKLPGEKNSSNEKK